MQAAGWNERRVASKGPPRTGAADRTRRARACAGWGERIPARGDPPTRIRGGDVVCGRDRDRRARVRPGGRHLPEGLRTVQAPEGRRRRAGASGSGACTTTCSRARSSGRRASTAHDWDDAAGRFWLMLEFVDGKPLRHCGFDHWLEAAAWLGRLHGRFAGQRDRLQACSFLMRHDADFFVAAAVRALGAVSGLSAGACPAPRPRARWLRPDRCARWRATRTRSSTAHTGPRTCSWSARPSRRESVPRTGSSPLSVARRTISPSSATVFDPQRLDALLDAYEREAERSGLPLRDRGELRHEIDCFRLHKTIRSLGHLDQWKHPAETAAKVVASAEEIAGVARMNPLARTLRWRLEGSCGRSRTHRTVEVHEERMKSGVYRLRCTIDGDDAFIRGEAPRPGYRAPERAGRPALASGRRPRRLGAPAARRCRGTRCLVGLAPLRGPRRLRARRGGGGPSTGSRSRSARSPGSTRASRGTALTPEFRVWGGDLGIYFYAASVRDAITALESVLSRRRRLGPERRVAVRAGCSPGLQACSTSRRARAEALARHGGPETLLHGDLWPMNVMVHENGRGCARPADRLGPRRRRARLLRPLHLPLSLSGS